MDPCTQTIHAGGDCKFGTTKGTKVYTKIHEDKALRPAHSSAGFVRGSLRAVRRLAPLAHERRKKPQIQDLQRNPGLEFAAFSFARRWPRPTQSTLSLRLCG